MDCGWEQVCHIEQSKISQSLLFLNAFFVTEYVSSEKSATFCFQFPYTNPYHCQNEKGGQTNDSGEKETSLNIACT